MKALYRPLITASVLALVASSFATAAFADSYTATAAPKTASVIKSSGEVSPETYLRAEDSDSSGTLYAQYSAVNLAGTTPAPTITGSQITSATLNLQEYYSSAETAGTLDFYVGPSIATSGLTNPDTGASTDPQLAGGGFGLTSSQISAGGYYLLGTYNYTPGTSSATAVDPSINFTNLSPATAAYLAANLGSLNLYTFAGDNTGYAQFEDYQSSTAGAAALVPSLTVNYTSNSTPAPEAATFVSLLAGIVSLGGLALFNKKRQKLA